ncbi:AraC family transcriptional regulator [Bradyrhizobium canariense]|uniref:helix-turn-helix transcriptional regulator n=1 Tax=Bradyrhizobium canariense TaxID=255045 RepID=UPI000A199BCD|nr:AraC family transcriptional regulator [Bradyrhizobium canariense]OSI60254.1 AraC family transcriptional regulator [Bradyrhizobium canariense]
MKAIVLARCALLAPFVDVLNDTGAPTERMLARFGLPIHPEQKPNDYFPLIPALQFVTAAQASHGLADFGFRAVQRLQFGHLSEQLQASIRQAPTLLAALKQWCRLVQFEDTFVRYWLQRHNDHLRVCSTNSGTDGVLHLEHSQWVQNVMAVYCVRQFAGPHWTPATISFGARYMPGVETQARWPYTRFLSGQKASWIDVPISLLRTPHPANAANSGSSQHEFEPISTDIVTALKLMLPSYLDERVPGIAEMAEITGTSVRSLQRELARAGLTYSRLLDQVRFEKGAELLRKTDARIIDVAFAAGYTDPAHFARAFRRMAGVTPREFRENAGKA